MYKRQDRDKLIGFNIGSAVPTKRWPPERFAEVADIFAAKGYKTVFFGGPMDEEMVAEATGYMQTRPIIATGHFAIGGLAAAMRRCCLIITNDSGPMPVSYTHLDVYKRQDYGRYYYPGYGLSGKIKFELSVKPALVAGFLFKIVI